VEDVAQAFRCRRCSYRADASFKQGKPAHLQGPAALGEIKCQAHKCRAAELESQYAETLTQTKQDRQPGAPFHCLKEVGATRKL